MEQRMAYCATCDRPVRVMVRENAATGATVDPDDVVCLDHGEVCGAGTVCPIFDVPTEKMKENLKALRNTEEGETP
jgi:hypothetical protein